MRKIIQRLSKHYGMTEENFYRLQSYGNMKQHPGWKVHQEMLMLCRGMIAEEVLSKEFTELDATEKDIRQRTYSNIDNFIRFLLNPLALAQKKVEFMKAFEETTKWK